MLRAGTPSVPSSGHALPEPRDPDRRASLWREAARFVCFLLLGMLVALGRPGPVSASVANSWTEGASDPAGTALGWSQSHWVPALQAMLIWGGSDTDGDNSVRLFDPLTNSWSYLWPNSNGSSGLQNRGEHVSFYVPARGAQGELWVLGGAYDPDSATSGVDASISPPANGAPSAHQRPSRRGSSPARWPNLGRMPAPPGAPT